MDKKIKKDNEKVIVGLCAGRHEMPVNEYIFNKVDDIFNFKSQEKIVMKFLEEKVGVEISSSVGINQADHTDILCYKGKKALVVYITGLTCLTATLIKCCIFNGVSLTLMHFDSASGQYVPQIIL